MPEVLHGPLAVTQSSTGLVVTEGVDAAANTGTVYSMEVGDTFSGTIDGAYDQDWVAVTLTAGETVTISQTGLSLSDPYLRLYNSSGGFLQGNDDGGPGLDSELTYTATYSGTYYVAAGAFSTRTGTYSLSVQEEGTPPPPPPPSDPLDAITWGSQLSSTSVDVYFGAAGYVGDGTTSEGFNAYQIAQFMAVFDLIESVSGLTFNIVNTAAAADFRLVMDSNEMSSGSYGRMNPPGYASGADAGVGVFNQNAMGSAAGGPMDLGGLGWYVIVHELMHGLGLAHPHDRGGNGTGNDSTIMDGVSSSSDTGDYALNQGHYTIMSYNWEFDSGVGTSGDPYLWGMAAGPGALDIAVLQSLYGANTTHNGGTNTYVLGDVHGAGAHWQAIWDTGGGDQIRYDGARNATIDLRAASLQDAEGGGGFNSAVEGVAGGYTIANGVRIENAMGGSGNDTIIGNDLNNRLSGREGDNLISGGLGNDTINVGSGNDTVFGEGGADYINGFGGNDSLNGGNGADTLRGGDNNDVLIGGSGNDSLNGGNHNDTINGGANDDFLIGGNGNDRITGGNGNDNFYGQNGMDTLLGGNGNDTVRGGGGEDVLSGGANDDTVFGGRQDDTMSGDGGDDVMVGGAGNDEMTGGTGEDFVSGAIGDDSINGGGQDDLVNGNQGDDTLVGGTGDDTLNGASGEDRLFGSAGNDALRGGSDDDYLNGGVDNDTLDAGSGNDTLVGGTGADTFQFRGPIDDDVITDFDATDVLRIHSNLLTGQTTGTDLFIRYGSFENGGVMLDFENGNSIFLQGVTSITDPDSAILIYG